MSLLIAAIVALLSVDLQSAQTRLTLPEQPFDANVWKLVGANPEQHVHPTEHHVEISISHEDTTQSVGFAPVSVLKGDFEIRGEFEIDEIATPKEGFGCGPTIYLTTRSPEKCAATIGRLNRVSDGEKFSAYWASTVDGQRKHHPQLTAASGNRGIMALKRTGETLTYSVGQTWDGPLDVIRTVEFGDDDVNYIRIGVDRGGDMQSVRVRWRRILIVSGVADRPEISPSPAATSNSVHVSGNSVILGILFVTAAGLSASWWFKRGRYLQ